MATLLAEDTAARSSIELDNVRLSIVNAVGSLTTVIVLLWLAAVFELTTLENCFLNENDFDSTSRCCCADGGLDDLRILAAEVGGGCDRGGAGIVVVVTAEDAVADDGTPLDEVVVVDVDEDGECVITACDDGSPCISLL